MNVSNATGPEEATTQPEHTNGRWLLLSIAFLALVGIAFWIIHYFLVGQYLESTNNAYLQADSVAIAPRISGYITQVMVQDNQQVSAGDTLLEIDKRPYIARLQQAQAEVAARTADIAQAKATLLMQQSSLIQARSQLTAAQASLRFATQEVARYAPLVRSGADSREHQENLQHTLERAQAEYNGMQAQVNTSQEMVHVAQARILQANAALQAAQADVAQAQISVDDAHIVSPISGRVGDKSAQIGQFLAPGMRTMTIVPTQQIYLVANYKETQIDRMHPGQHVDIKIDAFPSGNISGVVESISPGTGSQFALFPPENATGNFVKIVQRVPVRIRLDTDPNFAKKLVPGLSIEATVDTRDTRSK